jgi:hypothetical protein
MANEGTNKRNSDQVSEPGGLHPIGPPNRSRRTSGGNPWPDVGEDRTRRLRALESITATAEDFERRGLHEQAHLLTGRAIDLLGKELEE